MLTRLRRHYDISQIVWEEDRSCDVLDPTFIIAFEAVPRELEGTLICHKRTMVLRCISAIHDYPEGEATSKIRQNYTWVTEMDPDCMVLEARLLFENQPLPYVIGYPRILIPEPDKIHQFALLFDGIHLQLLCDGALLDQDFPYGRPTHHYPSPYIPVDKTVLEVLSDKIHNLRISNDLRNLKITEESVQEKGSGHFYMPANFNDWAGDITMCVFQGRLHLFYLYDRRHHGSRHSRGAHEFHHISSANLRDWEEHGAVVPIEEDWQTVGTGNAFVWNDTLYLAYGLHTERARDYQDTANHLLFEHLARFGNTGSFRFNEIGRLTPGGASYCWSKDGIHFTLSRRIMHFLENPTVRVMPDNSLTMTQDGIWASDHLGEWVLKQRGFPPRFEHSFARNCLDCPAYFDLEGWEYLVVGFTGFYGHPKTDSQWVDFTEKGWSIYDGTNVPMYATLSDGRVLECGWVRGCKDTWGAQLIFREVVSLGEGRVGKRWVSETLPEWSRSEEISERVALSNLSVNTLLEFTVDTASGEEAISFMVKDAAGKVAELQVDTQRCRAQVALASAAVEPFAMERQSFKEVLMEYPDITDFGKLPHSLPYKGHDFAMENLVGVQEHFLSVRILLNTHPKNQAMLMDCEIAGHHTIFQRCEDFKPVELLVTTKSGQKRVVSAKKLEE